MKTKKKENLSEYMKVNEDGEYFYDEQFDKSDEEDDEDEEVEEEKKHFRPLEIENLLK